jgi:hypothetical protein
VAACDVPLLGGVSCAVGALAHGVWIFVAGDAYSDNHNVTPNEGLSLMVPGTAPFSVTGLPSLGSLHAGAQASCGTVARGLVVKTHANGVYLKQSGTYLRARRLGFYARNIVMRNKEDSTHEHTT